VLEASYQSESGSAVVLQLSCKQHMQQLSKDRHCQLTAAVHAGAVFSIDQSLLHGSQLYVIAALKCLHFSACAQHQQLLISTAHTCCTTTVYTALHAHFNTGP
jgi:hypothetical protein